MGVSRVGKTPTCVYLALQYGVFAANYPLTEDDLESGRAAAAPGVLPRESSTRSRSNPNDCSRSVHERRPDSRYASRAQVTYELRAAEALFARYAIPSLDTSESSIEEIASRILSTTGIERRLRP